MITQEKALARFELLLNAAVGFTWGPLLWYFALHVVGGPKPLSYIVLIVVTIACGYIGARMPASWYALSDWERAGRGRVYERWFRIRWFKSWMNNGDRMNAWMRRRYPDHRVVRPTRAAAQAYVAKTIDIERAHFAWLTGALVPMVYGAWRGAWGFTLLWTLANIVTNAWPMALQRYLRVRAARATR